LPWFEYVDVTGPRFLRRSLLASARSSVDDIDDGDEDSTGDEEATVIG
jgi:hypothetical protein